jgi:ribosomal protein S18 acetylase RimI-like enzyme
MWVARRVRTVRRMNGVAVRRGYEGPADLRAMQRMVARVWSPDRTWMVGDLAWGRYQHAGREAEWPTALWESGAGDVLAWGWARLPGGLDLAVDPAHPELTGEVLDWFETVATAERLSVTIVRTEHAQAEVLAERGYQANPDDPGQMLQHIHDLRDIPAPAIPPGYLVRPITVDDLAERVAVHRAAFAPSRVTEESYAAVMAAWPYRPELDWVVQAPDGTFAASCLIWLDERNAMAELEPVGAHPEHRRRGLASAACSAAMRAARDLGARTGIVFSNNEERAPAAVALYRSLGFRVHNRTITYLRDR